MCVGGSASSLRCFRVKAANKYVKTTYNFYIYVQVTGGG
jgi:hypothetical protein